MSWKKGKGEVSNGLLKRSEELRGLKWQLWDGSVEAGGFRIPKAVHRNTGSKDYHELEQKANAESLAEEGKRMNKPMRTILFRLLVSYPVCPSVGDRYRRPNERPPCFRKEITRRKVEVEAKQGGQAGI